MLLSKYIKRILKGLLFMLLIVIFTVVLDAAFELDETVTENMLTAFSHTSNMDTVFVGNSVGDMLDAEIYSSLSGTRSFNMCTPAQTMELSLRNTMFAASQHKIKNVILLMSIDMIDDEDYNRLDQLYDRVIDSSSPWPDRIVISTKRKIRKASSPDMINTEKSINIFIPWENETTRGWDGIKENLDRRYKRLRKKDPLGNEIAYDLNRPGYDRFNADLSKEDMEILNRDIEDAAALDIPEGMLQTGNLERIAKLCNFCRKNDIKLYVIDTPHRTDYYDRYVGFRQASEISNDYLRDFISKRGGVFHDPEKDPNLHEILPDKYFVDVEHINSKYFDKSTKYLYEVLKGNTSF